MKKTVLLASAILITLSCISCSEKDNARKEYLRLYEECNEIEKEYYERQDTLLSYIFNKYVGKDQELYAIYDTAEHFSVYKTKHQFNTAELLYIAWVEYIRNFDVLDLDYPLTFFFNDPEFIVEKFKTFTEYDACEILHDNISFWYKEDGGLTNNY